MNFNDDKCKVMIINNKKIDICITMNGKQLEITDSERDLDIGHCSSLKWSYYH